VGGSGRRSGFEASEVSAAMIDGEKRIDNTADRQNGPRWRAMTSEQQLSDLNGPEGCRR